MGEKGNTSSTPSSQDYTHSIVKNLREKTGLKLGGKKGHSLKMSNTPNDFIKDTSSFCKSCGNKLEHSLLKLSGRK